MELALESYDVCTGLLQSKPKAEDGKQYTINLPNLRVDAAISEEEVSISKNLQDGRCTKSEMGFIYLPYQIPNYYAVRASTISSFFGGVVHDGSSLPMNRLIRG